MLFYSILAFGPSLISENFMMAVPAILIAFIISFILFFRTNKNLSQYFFLKQTKPQLELQKEVLNYPFMSFVGFVSWAIVGLLVSFGMYHQELAPLQSIILHVGLSTLLSGSLVAIFQLNIAETILEKHVLPHLLKGTRISSIPNIIRLPTYIRIQLLVITNSIGPSLFILFIYLYDRENLSLLLFILALTVFNGLWQGGFLLRNISQPIGQISGKLTRFRKGELEENPKPIFRTDALGEFSEMFDDLVDSIHERDFIRSTFNRYLDPNLVDDILNGRHELGGSEIEASVMFADIRGFTSMSEQLSPAEVVDLLNNYFEQMVQEITTTNGIPDKFLGDGLLAVWGVPKAEDDHAVKACLSAISMLDRLAFINKERSEKQLPIIEIGIGIHSGSVIAGNIGSRKKMEYTVIGDTVNTSSRLEGLTKTLGSPLIISGEVFDALPEHLKAKFEFSLSRQLRGKQKETRIYLYKTQMQN